MIVLDLRVLDYKILLDSKNNWILLRDDLDT